MLRSYHDLVLNNADARLVLAQGKQDPRARPRRKADGQQLKKCKPQTPHAPAPDCGDWDNGNREST